MLHIACICRFARCEPLCFIALCTANCCILSLYAPQAAVFYRSTHRRLLYFVSLCIVIYFILSPYTPRAAVFCFFMYRDLFYFVALYTAGCCILLLICPELLYFIALHAVNCCIMKMNASPHYQMADANAEFRLLKLNFINKADPCLCIYFCRQICIYAFNRLRLINPYVGFGHDHSPIVYLRTEIVIY